MPPLRQCLGIDDEPCTVLSHLPRCDEHYRIYEARTTRAKRARRPYTAAEQQRRAEAVAAHRAVKGDWCPGWRRSAHVAHDLTAEHPIDVVAGGSEQQSLTVLCRGCNSSKGASAQAARQRRRTRG